MEKKKNVYFVQVLLMSPDADGKQHAASAVKALEAAGHEPSLIKVEQVTTKTRFDEVERIIKAAVGPKANG